MAKAKSIWQCTLVLLPGFGRLWLHPPDANNEAPLSLLHECDKDGNLIVPDSFFKRGFVRNSFAHVMRDGRIVRYGKVIGRRDDLKEVRPNEKA